MRVDVEERWTGIGWAVERELGVVTDERGNVVHDGNGAPKTQPYTTLRFELNEVDAAGNLRVRKVRVPFDENAKRELVSALMGGVVLPAGNGSPAPPAI